MSRLNVSNLFNENEDGAPVVSGISTFSSPNYFVPPSGSTAQRPSSPGEGMIRFNTDSGHLEYYTGTHWADVIVNNNELGNQLVTNSAGGTGTRAVACGGAGSPVNKTASISYITVETLGNSQDFGDLTQGDVNSPVGAASRTRGLSQGGSAVPARQSTIEFVTIASTGSAADYGDLSVARAEAASVSNQTRAIVAGGSTPGGDSDVIDYGTIASTGTYQDFGNLVDDREAVGGGIANQVRGIIYGGQSPAQNTIEFVTISSTGDAQDFGDLQDTAIRKQGCSNSTRGVIAGGGPSNVTIQFVTIATKGNAQSFGDLTVARRFSGCAASPTRGVFMGGQVAPSPTAQNTIDYVTIASTGDAVDFGDMDHDGQNNGVVGAPAAFSNGHGGL